MKQNSDYSCLSMGKSTTTDPTITIHLGPWSNEIELGIQKTGQMKSLGFVHGMGEESTQHSITKEYLGKVCDERRLRARAQKTFRRNYGSEMGATAPIGTRGLGCQGIL